MSSEQMVTAITAAVSAQMAAQMAAGLAQMTAHMDNLQLRTVTALENKSVRIKKKVDGAVDEIGVLNAKLEALTSRVESVEFFPPLSSASAASSGQARPPQHLQERV